MPRRVRLSTAGVPWHIIQRGNNRSACFSQMKMTRSNNPEPELREAFAKANPDSVYDDCKNCLGNLALLEKPINIVAGNDFFYLKLPEYKKSKNCLTRGIARLTEARSNTSIRRINQKPHAVEQWSADALDVLPGHASSFDWGCVAGKVTLLEEGGS